MNELKIKRAYQPAEESDGMRILVDRLWPRGVSRERARLDRWAKEITPTPALRNWFGHRQELFEEFSWKYRQELSENPAAEAFARDIAAELKTRNVTLVYAAKSETCNHALILRDWLLETMHGKAADENNDAAD